MAKRKVVMLWDPFERSPEMVLDNGHVIKVGDLIKVKGIYGTKFKFLNLVLNPKTDVKWVDCIELDRGISGPFRSFYPDRIKPIIQRKKRVKRNRSSQTP